MPLTEVVHLRAYSLEDRDSALEVLSWIVPECIAEGLINISIKRSVKIANDIFCLLYWEPCDERQLDTSISRQIIYELSELGVVDHQLLVEHHCMKE